MLQVTNLSFSYSHKVILEQIQFSVPKGCIAGIVGANGCGKSTLLSLIAGSKKPKSGQIKLQGSCSYVPQDNPFFEDLTVLDNLFVWYPESLKHLKEELDQPLLSSMQIKEYLKLPVRKLSGGMKKRVSLASALLAHPDLLILDEPSAALDLPSKNQMHQYLQDYLAQGGTVLLSTHEESELAMCDHLFVLTNHRLKEIPNTLRGAQLLKQF